MSESGFFARKGVIYTILAIGVLTLAVLNFWGWFFIRGIDRQILRQIGQHLANTAEVYALLISDQYAFEDMVSLAKDDIKLVSLQQLLYEFEETGDLENIFIVSLDRQIFIDPEVSLEKNARIRDFPLNDSLFRQASLGEKPEAERITFAGQYFLTTYTPVTDFAGNVMGVLVLEAPAHIFSTLQYFKQALLFLGVGGLGIMILFAGIIVIAIRRLFRAEDRLHQQTRLAQLGQMAAMVAHEIRNPLSIIKGSADVLRKKYASQNDELFDFMPEEINRLNRLVNDFLQFARQREVKLEPVNADAALQKIISQVNDPRIQTAFIGSSPEIMADPDAFKQVMLNIVDNAQKVIPANGLITIRSKISPEKPRRLVIEIIDNGPGMPAETLDKIYEPFFSTRATGSGLGMAITRQLVEQMKGRISIKSRENKGTTVRLEFPL